MKVAVMTDSTAYIPEHVRAEKNIHMLPLSVVFGDTEYQEEVDITTEEFFNKLKEADELPKTSQPAIGEVLTKLEELSKTYDAVISIHLSSGVSGTFQTVANAAEEIEGIDVYPYDSEFGAMPQGFFVLEAAKMAKEGSAPQEILQSIDKMKESMTAYFIVDDLTNLHRGGRLNSAQFFVGSMLKVKPILHIVDTVIVPFEKVRTKKKAMKRITDILEKEILYGKELKVSFLHANDEKTASQIRQNFLDKYPKTDTQIDYIGPVLGTHLGEGAIAVAWYEK